MDTTTTESRATHATSARLKNVASLTPARLLELYKGRYGFWRVKTCPALMDGELRTFWTDKFYEGIFEDVLDTAFVELGSRFLRDGICGEIRPFNLTKL